MSFFRNRYSLQNPTNTELLMGEYKKSVKQKIVDAIKDLQIEYSDGNQTIIVSNNELSNQLVCGLEALFIHGIKGSFIGKISSAVFGSNVAAGTSDVVPSASSASAVSRLPEPNFWMFVMVFSHRDTIQRIEKLPQVTTDVGRARSWLRLALNDGLLGAYLQAMQKDRVTAQKFYQRFAILRDPDLLDVLTKYICGIEQYKFDLALNSSMLNRWQTAPLILAGLWTPNVAQSKAPPPVQVAVDAAEALDEEGIDPLAASTPAQIPTGPAGLQYLSRGLLNEDEALKLILQGRSFGSGSSSAAASPVGTPSTSSGLAVRVVKVKKTAAAKKPDVVSHVSQDDHLNIDEPKSSGDENSSIVSTGNDNISSANNDTLYVTAMTDNSFDVMTSNDVSKEDVGSDSDVEESIYSVGRRSLQEDSESLSGVVNFTTAVTTPATFSPTESTVDNEKEGSSVQTDDKVFDEEVDNKDFSNNNVVVDMKIGLQDETLTESTVKRENLMSISSTASSSTSKASLNLAVPHLAGFIESWNPFGSGRFFDTPPDVADDTKFGFSLQPNVRIGALNEASSQALMHLFDRVVREEGLDYQNYKCMDCSKAIGTLFGPAKVCSYTKLYYCDECHLDEVSVIPAKVVYCWNFQVFKVSRKAKIFLDSISIEPIIDVKTFNSALFEFAPSLNEVYTLRKQLKYMNAYLMTCNAGGAKTKEAFNRLIWPRAYLHEDVDKCSIKDLEEIRSGKFKSLLGHATRLCREHILACILCQGKGFICEVCRHRNPIYPFELDSIAQCPKCFTVFHLDCSATLTNCPKCDRIEARNLNWHISEAKLARQLASTGSSAELSALNTL